MVGVRVVARSVAVSPRRAPPIWIAASVVIVEVVPIGAGSVPIGFIALIVRLRSGIGTWRFVFVRITAPIGVVEIIAVRTPATRRAWKLSHGR